MKTLARIALILGCIVLPNIATAQTAPKGPVQRTSISDATLATLEAHTDVTFARYGERELQLDLYRPRGVSQPLPAILCIHGGGWFKGDRNSMRPFAQALAETPGDGSVRRQHSSKAASACRQ